MQGVQHSESGRTRRPARSIHERQLHTILGLAGDLGWSESIMTRFLRRFHGCDSLNAIRTARQAETVIRSLLERRQQRENRRAIRA